MKKTVNKYRIKLADTENVKDSNTKKKGFTDKHSYPVIGTAVLTQDFEDLREIVGKKGEVVELSEDYDEIFDAYKIVIDGTRFYASPREIEDIRIDSSRKVKDSKDKCSYVLKTGVRSDAFKQYLRDRGLKFEPSQDGEYTHFVVFNADEAVDRRARQIVAELKDSAKVKDEKSLIQAKEGDTVIDTKTNKEGKVVKIGQSGNYDVIYVDFGRGLRRIVPMDDMQVEGRYTLKDSKNKCSYVLKTGVRSDAFKQYLRDRGLKFEPSQDGEYTHFVVFNADEAVDRRVDSIIKTLKDKKFGDAGFSKEDVEDAVWFFEGELHYINGSKKFKEDDEDDEHQHIVAQMSMRGWNDDFERAVRKKYWDLENIPLKEAVRKIITWLRSIKEE